MTTQSQLSVPAVRVAIVTGGAQGIGRAISLRLAADGLDVAVDDIPSKLSRLNEVVAEIEKLGWKAIALTYDVSNEDEVKEMVDKTVGEFGRLDVMVTNAGIIGKDSNSILEGDVAMWGSVWSVNTLGTLLCYKYGARQMIKQGFGGRLIAASSICGKRGFADLAAYCASKAAILSLTQTVASLVSYLASPESHFINGQSISVDGGIRF